MAYVHGVGYACLAVSATISRHGMGKNMGSVMARALNRLTARAVENHKRNGRVGYFADGGGLLLQVSGPGSASWVFRYQRNGRRRELGLGPTLNVSLALARTKAEAMRAQLGQGIEPQPLRAAAREAAAGRMTFDECAEKFIASRRHEWANPKHAAQWTATLETYASPIIGKLDVAQIDTHHVMAVLEPIWTAKPETASRVRGRIESVLAWATTSKRRSGENPARWRGHLQTLLPKTSRVKNVTHHAALPYVQMPAFMTALRNEAGTSARALEFTILTAARTAETIGATWDEFDLKAATWIVPGERMKAGKEHRVPLSPAALAILQRMKKVRESEYVFPGGREGKPLSNMAMATTLKRMGRDDITVHGFRSTFRDWAGETTPHAREVIEHALAHQLKDKAEAAYQRGTLFDKRAALMRDWAAYCLPSNAKARARS